MISKMAALLLIIIKRLHNNEVKNFKLTNHNAAEHAEANREIFRFEQNVQLLGLIWECRDWRCNITMHNGGLFILQIVFSFLLSFFI